jgi:hypothetical protein
MRGIARELALFALFTALAVALTWPLALHPGTAYSDLGDPLLNTWILDWDFHALTHDPLHLYDAPMFYPARYTLAFSENLIGIAVLMLPFHWLGLTPATVYTIAMLLGFALSGYGMSVLARVAGRSTLASIVAGILFAFCAYKFDHLAHLQIIWSGWLPLILAALLRFWRAPTTGRAAQLTVVFVANGLTNIHFLLFSAVPLAVTIVMLAIAIPQKSARFWLRLSAALALAGLLLLPFLLPYKIVSEKYGLTRTREETLGGSATWSDWLTVSGTSVAYSRLGDPALWNSERQLFPGALAPFLLCAAVLLVPRRRNAAGTPARRARDLRLLDAAIVIVAWATYIGIVAAKYKLDLFGHRVISIDNASGPAMILLVLIMLRLAIQLPLALTGGEPRNLHDAFARSRFTPEEWSAAAWLVVGVIASLGLHAFLHDFLYRHLPIYRAVRAPARWAVIAYIGLSVWAALGFDQIVERRRGWRRPAAVALLVALALFDVLPRIRYEHVVPGGRYVDEWLAREKLRVPILQLPMDRWNLPYEYLFGGMLHHAPQLTGTSGFETPLHAELRRMTREGEYNDVLLALLEKSGCALLIVHPEWLREEIQWAPPWIEEGIRSGRIAFLRRFDRGLNGDYVFALTRVMPDWQRLRASERRDAAGFTEEDQWKRTVANLPAYNEHTFFADELPRTDQETSGPLLVRGWALSPNGIAKVRVRVHSAKHVFEARLVPRPDIKARWPWYPKTPNPGYSLVIPKRPKDIPAQTDVQIEIVDGAGKVSFAPDRLIVWH